MFFFVSPSPFRSGFFSSSKDGCIPHVPLLLVLKDDLPHAEVEHGADVDHEQQGAHHRQRQH